jgi:hypothetical protein
MWKNQRWWLFTGLLILTAALLVACGPGTTATTSPVSTSGSIETEEMPSELAAVVTLIKQDLAEKVDMPADLIRLVSSEAMDWPSSALGCPQAGMSYADVITPGYRVILEASGQTYTYHVGDGSFVLCEREDRMQQPEKTPEETPPKALTGTAETLVEQAKQDLVERTGVGVDEISLQYMQAVEWRDSSLGCPQPGMNYLMVITPGYLIRLEAEGTIYEYHTSQNHVVLCRKPTTALQRSPETEARLAKVAQTDLARRLGIARGDIQVVQIKAVDWPDTSLGCPRPGMMYAQMITPGYQIILSARGQEYDYRADLKRAFLCETTEDLDDPSQ